VGRRPRRNSQRRQSRNLARERLTLEDLYAALRRHGVADVTQVHVAMLEDDGVISVVRRG